MILSTSRMLVCDLSRPDIRREMLEVEQIDEIDEIEQNICHVPSN